MVKFGVFNWSTMLRTGEIIYQPSGFIIAERVIQGEDCYGVRVGFWCSDDLPILQWHRSNTQSLGMQYAMACIAKELPAAVATPVGDGMNSIEGDPAAGADAGVGKVQSTSGQVDAGDNASSLDDGDGR